MSRNLLGILVGAALVAGVVVMTDTETNAARPPGPVIFVSNQGLYYDSIITADPLPPHGPFQLLEMGPAGLETEFGPGDVGYRGGRWVEDFNGDGVPHYFSCPLLGPGRPTP